MEAGAIAEAPELALGEAAVGSGAGATMSGPVGRAEGALAAIAAAEDDELFVFSDAAGLDDSVPVRLASAEILRLTVNAVTATSTTMRAMAQPGRWRFAARGTVVPAAAPSSTTVSRGISRFRVAGGTVGAIRATSSSSDKNGRRLPPMGGSSSMITESPGAVSCLALLGIRAFAD